MDSTTLLAYASGGDDDGQGKGADKPSSRDGDKEKSKKKPLAPGGPSSERESEPATEESSDGG